MSNIAVVALYKFVSLPNYKLIRNPLLEFCKTNKIKGTLLLAHEGINGTISGPKENIEQVINYLKNIPELADLDYKTSYTDSYPFLRMKVKLKKEIVTMGVPSIDPNKVVGQHLNSQEWNELIQDPDTILIDTRNPYETDIGTFKNAICPDITNFRDFPEYFRKHFADKKDKKIAMFCTGGIRCEKSTSFALEEGYPEVYHLKGGILKYLEETPEAESLWQGDCFVFDERVAVNHKLEKSIYDQCHGCRHPITQEDMQSPLYKRGVHCHLCYNKFDAEHYNRAAERQYQMDLAKHRGQVHLGESR
jgi:UPF0176 protein